MPRNESPRSEPMTPNESTGAVEINRLPASLTHSDGTLDRRKIVSYIAILLSMRRRTIIHLLLILSRDRRIKKYRHMVRTVLHTRPRIVPIRTFQPRSRNIVPASEDQLYEDTNLYRDHFEEILNRIRSEIESPRWNPDCRCTPSGPAKATVLSTASRLYLVLKWIKAPDVYKRFGPRHGVCPAFVSREIHHIMPILRANLNEIRLTPEDFPNLVLDRSGTTLAAGIIDCSCCPCNRTHPGESSLYRGDAK